MIIVVGQYDPSLMALAQLTREGNPAVFGEVYHAFNDEIPRLEPGENFFIVAHGASNYQGEAVIGTHTPSGKKPVVVNARELYTNIREIFPDNYTGRVYVDACESADHDPNVFSFAQSLTNRALADHDGFIAFGRNGLVPYGITEDGQVYGLPTPDSPDWVPGKIYMAPEKWTEITTEIADELIKTYDEILVGNPPLDKTEAIGKKLATVKDCLTNDQIGDALTEIKAIKQEMVDQLSQVNRQHLQDYEISAFEVVDSVMDTLSEITTILDEPDPDPVEPDPDPVEPDLDPVEPDPDPVVEPRSPF